MLCIEPTWRTGVSPPAKPARSSTGNSMGVVQTARYPVPMKMLWSHDVRYSGRPAMAVCIAARGGGSSAPAAPLARPRAKIALLTPSRMALAMPGPRGRDADIDHLDRVRPYHGPPGPAHE
jgi:hypothetical protein